jgi:hypothetical protein
MVHPAGKIVPQVAQVIKIHWDNAASMDVFELEQGSGEFKVTKHYPPQQQDEAIQRDEGHCINRSNLNMPQMESHAGSRQSKTHHIVIPVKQWCSCGVWQDFEYTCQHFVAYFQKWRECDSMQTLQQLHVSIYYRYDSLQNLYTTPNINPVVVDAISYDGTTKPPVTTQRQTGRLKVKRF